VAVAVNVGVLVIYKYAHLVGDTLSWVSTSAGGSAVEYRRSRCRSASRSSTFHALSYVIDVSRGASRAQKNPLNLALYIALFPQLVAGPIVRYAHLAPQIAARETTPSSFATGVRRFIIGLGKKVLIANTLAVPADAIFRLPSAELTFGLSWLGIVCYTLQIYFDFSLLGHGHRPRPHVRIPFFSRISITHMSRRQYGSSGGGGTSRSRPGSAIISTSRSAAAIDLRARLSEPRDRLPRSAACGTARNGASSCGAVPRVFPGTRTDRIRENLKALPAPVGHVYLLLVVAVGWVFFRAAARRIGMMGIEPDSAGNQRQNDPCVQVQTSGYCVPVPCPPPAIAAKERRRRREIVGAKEYPADGERRAKRLERGRRAAGNAFRVFSNPVRRYQGKHPW